MELHLVSPAPTRRVKLPERVCLSGSFPIFMGRDSGVHHREGTKIGLDRSITGVSRYHCKIEKAPGSPHKLVISDHGSSNGTALRGTSGGVAVRVGSAQVPLQAGQELLLGCCCRNVREGQRLHEPVQACVVYKVVDASRTKRPRDAASSSESSSGHKKPKLREAEQEQLTIAPAKGGEEEEEDRALYSLLACSICMEMPAAAAHLSCGHVMCFTCAHARFFHQSVEDASAYGFQDRIRQCPIDRKSITHMSRALVVDALVDELNRRPVPMVKADERPAWEARRRDGQELAAHYEKALKGNPRNLIGVPREMLVMLVLGHTAAAKRGAARRLCQHCRAPLVANEAEVQFTCSSFRRGSSAKVHVRCVREAVFAAARADTPIYTLVRFRFLGRLEKPGSRGAEQAQLKEATTLLRRELDETKHCLPWWVNGPLELSGSLFQPEGAARHAAGLRAAAAAGGGVRGTAAAGGGGGGGGGRSGALTPAQARARELLGLMDAVTESDEEEEEEEEDDESDDGPVAADPLPNYGALGLSDNDADDDDDDEEEEEEESDDGPTASNALPNYATLFGLSDDDDDDDEGDDGRMASDPLPNYGALGLSDDEEESDDDDDDEESDDDDEEEEEDLRGHAQDGRGPVQDEEEEERDLEADDDEEEEEEEEEDQEEEEGGELELDGSAEEDDEDDEAPAVRPHDDDAEEEEDDDESDDELEEERARYQLWRHLNRPRQDTGRRHRIVHVRRGTRGGGRR